MDKYFLYADLMFLGSFLYDYFWCIQSIKTLKTAPEFKVDSELKEYVEQQPKKKISYAAIRGKIVLICEEDMNPIDLEEYKLYQFHRKENRHYYKHVNANWILGTNVDNKLVKIIEPATADLIDKEIFYKKSKSNEISGDESEILTLTAFGEIESVEGSLVLKRSSVGPFILVISPKTKIIDRLKISQSINLNLSLLCVAFIPIIVGGMFMRKN